MKKLEVRSLLKDLLSLNRENAASALGISRILTAFREQRLYESLGHSNFSDFISAETPFSKNVAYGHTSFLKHAKRLGYNANEMREILEYIGTSRAARGMAGFDSKVSIKKLIKAAYEGDHAIAITATFTEQADADWYEGVLEQYGLNYDENGRRHNLTEAIMTMAAAAETGRKNVA